MPASPIATPSHARRPGRVPPPTPCSSAIHSGTDATMSAVRPEGTRVSDHTTAPLPPSSISAPTSPAEAQWRAVGHGAPRRRSHANIVTPASRKRRLAIRNGGMSAIAQRIAR